MEVHQLSSGSVRAPVWPGLVGGRYLPLTSSEMGRIHRTDIDVTEQIEFADPSMVQLVTARSASRRSRTTG